MTGQPRYRCHACGVSFKAWAPAERHADTERHHRLELVLSAAVQHPAPSRREPGKVQKRGVR